MEKLMMLLVAGISGMGYIGIVILMAIESSFLPLPSELVIPPAGYLAAKGLMNIYIVIICGTLGSIFGALVNYYIAVRLGRGILLKYGKHFFINEIRFKKIESFFLKHGEITTFIGRLLPVVRHYISFPAGFSRMNMNKFVFYTGLGSAIWVAILAYLGYYIGNNMDMIKAKVKIILIILMPVLVLMIIIYVYLNKKFFSKSEER